MLTSLMDQMHWANARMIEVLQAHMGSEHENQLLRLASHILTAETLWISRALGRDYVRNAFLDVPLNDMSAKNDANHAEFLALLKTDAQGRVDYSMMNGTPMNSSLEEIFLHVVTHGFHHRGQMASLASQDGWTFPDASFISFSRKG